MDAEVICIRTGARLSNLLCEDCGKRSKERNSHRCASCAHHVQTEQRVSGTSCAGCRCLLLPKSRIAFDPATGEIFCSARCAMRHKGVLGEGGA